MPLRSGSSDKVIQDNIRCLLEKDGCGYTPPYKDPARKEYTPPQAAAIAYAKAGKRKAKAETLKGNKQTQSKQSTSDSSEEGQMAQGDVRSIAEMAKKIDELVSEMSDLPEWVQAKITKAQDYLTAVTQHLSHPGDDKMAKNMAEGKDHDKDGDIDSEDWKMARDKAIKEATAESGEDKDPCWKDYEMVGMKKGKGGKPVPNCVKMEESDYSEIEIPDGWSVSDKIYKK